MDEGSSNSNDNDRWRKDIMRSHTRIRVNYDSGTVTPEMLRYKKMCSRFYKVADLATDDPDSCSLVMEWLEAKMNELYLKKYPTATLKPMEGNSSGNSPTDAPPKVQDPKGKKGKGRPRETRFKAPIEGSTKKPKKTKKSSQKVNDDAGEPSQPAGVLSTQQSVIMTQNTSQNNHSQMGNMNFRWGFSEHIQSFNHPSGSYGMMAHPCGPYGTIPPPSGPYGMMPQPSGPYGTIPPPSGPYGMMPHASGPYRMMPQPSGPYGMMSQPSGPYGMMSQPSMSSSGSIE